MLPTDRHIGMMGWVNVRLSNRQRCSTFTDCAVTTQISELISNVSIPNTLESRASGENIETALFLIESISRTRSIQVDQPRNSSTHLQVWEV